MAVTNSQIRIQVPQFNQDVQNDENLDAIITQAIADILVLEPRLVNFQDDLDVFVLKMAVGITRMSLGIAYGDTSISEARRSVKDWSIRNNSVAVESEDGMIISSRALPFELLEEDPYAIE